MPEITFDDLETEEVETDAAEFDNLDTDAPSTKIKVGDTELTEAEIREAMELKSGYTKKRQAETAELKEARQAAQELEQLKAEFARDPQSLIKGLQELAGQGRDGQGRFTSKIDPNEAITDFEKAVVAENQELRSMMEAVYKTMPTLERQAQESVAEKQASIAALTIRQEFGVDTNAIELMALQQKHKTSDPMTAFRAEHYGKAKPETKPIPNMEKQEDVKLIPHNVWANKDQPWSADKLQRAISKGYTILDDKGKPWQPTQ